MNAATRYKSHCRLLLRAYPRSWRRHREEEILGVLLALRDDDPGPARDRPSWTVQLDLVAGGVQARWDRIWSFLPAAVRGRIALLSTVLGAAVSTVAIVFGEVAWPGAPAPDPVFDPVFDAAATPPLLQTAGIVVYGTWLVAFAVLLLGRAHAARWWLAVTAAAAVVLMVATVVPRPPLHVLGPVALAALLATAGHLPTRRTTRGWVLVAYLLLTGGLGLVLGLATPDWQNPVWWFYRSGGTTLLATSVLVVAVAAGLIAAGASTTGRAWFLATSITVLPYVYLLIFATYGRGGRGGEALIVAATVSAVPVLLLVGAVLGRLTRRDPADAGTSARDV